VAPSARTTTTQERFSAWMPKREATRSLEAKDADARGGELTMGTSVAEKRNERQFARHREKLPALAVETSCASSSFRPGPSCDTSASVEPWATKTRAERCAILVAFAVVALFAVRALLQPREDFDLMAYVGVVRAYDGETGARERSLADLRAALDDGRYAWMTGRDAPESYARAMATDDRVFAQQLVWFRGRPLFTRSAWLLSKLGVPIPRALHLVAWASTVAVAWLLFVGTGGGAGRGPPSAAWSVLRVVALASCGALFHLDELAASALSDPLGAALVLASLLLVFTKAAPRAGLLLAVVAVLARSDAAIYAVGLAAFVGACALQKKEPPVSFGAASLSALASVAVRWWVERGSYGWRALVSFRRITLELHPADVRHALSLEAYLGVVRAWALEVYTCQVVAALVLVVLVARRATRATLADPWVAFACLMVPLSVVRFLAFPDWDPRFFVAPLGFFFLGAIRAVSLSRGAAPPVSRVPSQHEPRAERTVG